jgi:hypothetical protein
MYDSLPMVLLRFEILLKLYEARELGWVAYFFPWVLANEVMSHPRVRVEWFNIAYCYLMKCTVTYRNRPTGPGVKPFGTEGGDPATRRNCCLQALSISYRFHLLMSSGRTIPDKLS